jgi:rifampin ADP-ribosylating transferase
VSASEDGRIRRSEQESDDMSQNISGTTDGPRTRRLYHGSRADLSPGDPIEPGDHPHVYLTPDLDAAIWEAEIADGEGSPRVYIVEPTGPIEDASGLPDHQSPGHPSMSWRSRDPLRVTGEVADWLLFHGTRADLSPGDLIAPGHTPNYGDRGRTTPHVYLARTLDAAIWGAELAAGEGRERIYIVEPTGPVEDDPNVTDKKFRGNPTKSFRSREPVRVTGEITDWQGHPPERIQAMKEWLAKLEREGVGPIDD